MARRLEVLTSYTRGGQAGIARPRPQRGSQLESSPEQASTKD